MTFTNRLKLWQRTLVDVIHHRRIQPSAAQAVTLLWLIPFASAQVSDRSALDELLRTDATTFVTGLKAVRPVSPEVKMRVLESLPLEGEVTTLGKSARLKVASLDSILRVYGRNSVYVIKVIAVRQAFIGLHERAVLLISQHALDLLGSRELQALAAHEMGHDFAYERYRRAANLRLQNELHSIELYCDTVAVLTLIEVGLDVDNLVTGLEKLERFNRLQFGAAFNEDSHPLLLERKRFAKQVATWARSASPALSARRPWPRLR